MNPMSEHNLISESQARQLIEDEIQKLGPSILEKVSLKLTETFTKKELYKTLENLKESVDENNLKVREIVSDFVKSAREEIIHTNHEYKKHTKDFIEEISPLYAQSLEREKTQIQTKKKELDQLTIELRAKNNIIQESESSIKLKEEQIKQDREAFEANKQALAEKEDKLQKNVELLKRKIEKFERQEEELSHREKTALDKTQAADNALSKLVPPFISQDEGLGGFFDKISEGGSFSGTSTHLVAQLYMLNSYFESGDLRNLNNCLKEIGRAVFAYCYENNLDRTDIPIILAEVINTNEIIQSNGVVIQVPCEGAPIESTWMYDDSAGRGNSISRILTWSLRDMQNGTAIAKAEIES